MLRVDLRALDEGPVETAGVVPAADAAFGDLEFDLAGPVQVSGRIMESGPGRYFWHGRLRTTVRTACRRCLTPVTIGVDQDVQALFTAGADEGEDPSVYPLPARATELDLRPVIREELILAVPAYTVCREDCRGICPRCGVDLNTGSCSCRPERDPRWAALEGLDVQRSDDDTR